MERIKVKPALGLCVLDPDLKRPMAPTGAMVTLTGYWRRRIKDGSVLVVDEKKKEKPVETLKSGGNK